MATARPHPADSTVGPPLLPLPSCVLQMILTRHGLSARDLVAVLRSGLVPRRDLAAAARHRARGLPYAWLATASEAEPWPEAYVRLEDLLRFAPAAAVAGGQLEGGARARGPTLWACGANAAGQTGILPSALAPIVALTPVPRLPPVVHAAAGMAHSLLVAADGTLYSAGANFNDGRLGLGNEETNPPPCRHQEQHCQEYLHRRISGSLDAGWELSDNRSRDQVQTHNRAHVRGHLQANDRVHDFNSSSEDTYADIDGSARGAMDIDENSAGHNSNHELQGVEVLDQHEDSNALLLRTPSLPFTRVPLARRHVIAQCAAGGKHSLALTIAGVVLAAGDNSRGQLGFADRVDRATFAPPPLPRGAGRVVQIAAGAAHSVLLTEFGKVYVCGENRNAQLGLGMSAGLSRASFVEVSPIPDLSCHVAAGEEHTLILSSSRRTLYGAGLNCAGQLGDGGTRDRASFVQLLCNLRDNLDIAQVSTSRTDGVSIEQTGCLSTDALICAPELILGMSAGGSHSLLVTSCGRLLVAGECFFRHGEFRPKNEFSPVATGVSEAAAGWSHSVVITGSACLIAVVGDNPYVDPGTDTTIARGRFAALHAPGIPLFVAAGGAHTLVLMAAPG
jgi:alpha-tubulin suppressor-like RCC1 family protein